MDRKLKIRWIKRNRNEKLLEMLKDLIGWEFETLSVLLKIDIGLGNMKKHKQYVGSVTRDFKTNLKHEKAGVVEARGPSNTPFF